MLLFQPCAAGTTCICCEFRNGIAVLRPKLRTWVCCCSVLGPEADTAQQQIQSCSIITSAYINVWGLLLRHIMFPAQSSALSQPARVESSASSQPGTALHFCFLPDDVGCSFAVAATPCSFVAMPLEECLPGLMVVSRTLIISRIYQ